MHRQRGARARTGRPRRAARAGFAADVVLLEAPDWRYLAYHLGGDVVGAVVRGGDLAWSRGRRAAS